MITHIPVHMFDFLTSADILVISTALIATVWLFDGRRTTSLPPGPKGWALIGNVFDIPKSHPWRTFASWGDRWGKMVSITLFGQTIVILNSARVVFEMLDKKSAIYSDRPTWITLVKSAGWDQFTAFLPYGARLRETRKLFTPVLGSRKSISVLKPPMESEISLFLPRVVTYPSPDDFMEQITKTVTGTVVRIAYGYHPREEKDRMVQIAKTAMEEFSATTLPGAFNVDFFPILRYLPSWMPGGSWKRNIKTWHSAIDALYGEPFDFVKQQMAAGVAEPNFTAGNLEGDHTPEREELIKHGAGSLFGGGEDTSVCSIEAFFLAAMCYPDVFKKAQHEVDTVIGNDRLPTIDDRDNLPYVNAVILEVFRWAPPVPLGIPHRLTEDDVQDGYFLPKGTTVIANIWQLTHDPETYEDPFTFNPDRFIACGDKEPERDPRDFVWGFGRRICPGQHLAEACIFLALVKSIAVFDVKKPIEDGKVIEPVVEFTTGTISHPLPFKCSVTPRSAKAEALIREIPLV